MSLYGGGNPSAAYVSAHQFQEAADDAAQCIALNPDFVKGAFTMDAIGSNAVSNQRPPHYFTHT